MSSDTTDGRPLTAAEQAIIDAYRSRPMPSEEAVRRLQAVRYEARREVPPPTGTEAQMLEALCGTLGFREAFHRLMGDNLPPESEAEDQGDDDQVEGQADDDQDDRETDDQEDGEREPDHADRPLYRQQMTFTAPKDDVYAAESVTVEVIVTHERIEGLATMRDLPEHDQAGWHWWGFGNFEIGVRPVGD